jgi:nicotinate (nicotinamide) nucleotide adenylyltransferase
MSSNVHVWMGGSFSPPTIGHLNTGLTIAAQLSKCHPDATINIYYVPVNSAYNKASVKEEYISTADRLTLLELLLEKARHHYPAANFILADHEATAPTAIKTYDSITQLMAVHNIPLTDRIYLAVGQDNIEGLLKGGWYKWRELLETYNFIIFPRDCATADKGALRMVLASSANAPADLADRLTIIDAMSDGVSSTALRSAIADGRLAGAATLTLPTIIDYIICRGLYK